MILNHCLYNWDILKKADAGSGFETVLKYAKPNLPASAKRVSLNYKNQKEKLKEVGILSRAGNEKSYKTTLGECSGSYRDMSIIALQNIL
jgi:hypothetical protein